MSEYANTKGLLFDLDGTLLDSYPEHLEANRRMFARFGVQISEEMFRAHYSPNWYQSYESLGLPRELWKLADKYWLEEASQSAPGLFPGTLETLQWLGEHYRLGLVTSGSRKRVLRDLERNGIAGCFATIVTGDDVRQPKPAPDGLAVALGALGLQAVEAVYIGDSLADLEMAQAARVAFIGIPSQFASLMPDSPCRQVASIGELTRIFNLL